MPKDTELRLSFWRDGSTKAERLAATVLRLSGFEDIDPQSPIGGPDGKKDITCQKAGARWIGAVYFPSAPISFTSIKKKFASDLAGVSGAFGGFVFVTNQNLTPTQRDILAELASAKGKECSVLHLQQLQNILDSPPGYGARIEYLGIGMTVEEQLSWVVDSDSQTAQALKANTRELLALRAAVDRIGHGQKHIIKTMQVLETPAVSVATPDLISVSTFTKTDAFSALTATLTPELVLLFHRLTCFDYPSRVVGHLRSRKVWLGTSDGAQVTHVEPPEPDQVEEMLKALCDEWRTGFSALRSKTNKLEAIAKFHSKFLRIHPFLDGNGRVGRALLMQQCIDLFGKADMSLMNKGADYYAALKEADGGDNAPLMRLLEPIVEK